MKVLLQSVPSHTCICSGEILRIVVQEDLSCWRDEEYKSVRFRNRQHRGDDSAPILAVLHRPFSRPNKPHAREYCHTSNRDSQGRVNTLALGVLLGGERESENDRRGNRRRRENVVDIEGYFSAQYKNQENRKQPVHQKAEIFPFFRFGNAP